ncbi:MAG: VIT1/CCC1 transporter family protein [Bacteroidales bacterium]|nr:VIT1/CCC1 transporter family protein [Bacteroidales bacterium]
MISTEDVKIFLQAQQNELTESLVYKKLASIEKDAENKKILLQLSADEAEHAGILKKYTQKTVQPNRWRVNIIFWLAKIFGLTFAIKLMERGEEKANDFYLKFNEYPDLQKIAHDEANHENQLIGMINEERLEYMGSVVLGLNDALVEFTGALAGFTLALNNAPLIALTGSITGIAAALSMASSEYLSTKSEKDATKHPVKAAIYTGFAYIVTVTALVTPFIIFSNVLISLAVMLAMALIIIALFNYYYSVARGESFKRRFGEMAILSFSVAGVSFLIGYLLKYFTGVEA